MTITISSSNNSGGNNTSLQLHTCGDRLKGNASCKKPDTCFGIPSLASLPCPLLSPLFPIPPLCPSSSPSPLTHSNAIRAYYSWSA